MRRLPSVLYGIGWLAVIATVVLGIAAFGYANVNVFERSALTEALAARYAMLSIGALLSAPLWFAIGRIVDLLDEISRRPVNR